MTDKPKKTAFDEAVEGGAVADSDHEERVGVPRTVFTKDATLDLSKLQISTLRVAQGMTQEVTDRKAAIGQFVLTNYKAVDDVEIVPLGAGNTRIYKPDPTKPALCSAPTGDFGFGNPGGVCADCELGKWGKYNEETGKSEAPKCREGVIIRAYSITHRTIVDFPFLGAEQSKGGFIQQQAMSFGWASFVIKLTVSKKENKRGAWFVPEIEMLGEVPEDHQGIVNKWFEVFSASQADSKEQALKMLGGSVPVVPASTESTSDIDELAF